MVVDPSNKIFSRIESDLPELDQISSSVRGCKKGTNLWSVFFWMPARIHFRRLWRLPPPIIIWQIVFVYFLPPLYSAQFVTLSRNLLLSPLFIKPSSTKDQAGSEVIWKRFFKCYAKVQQLLKVLSTCIVCSFFSSTFSLYLQKSGTSHKFRASDYICMSPKIAL